MPTRIIISCKGYSVRFLPLLLLALPTLAMAQNEIVVSLQDHHVYVVNGDDVVADYPAVVGKRSTPTPAGHYRISEIQHHPIWFVPPSIMKEKHHPKNHIVPAGPHNPLGLYFMRLGSTNIGIHGTNAPSKVPGARSHGCIRLKNGDVTQLVKLVHRGTSVTVIKGSFAAQLEDVPDAATSPANLATQPTAQPGTAQPAFAPAKPAQPTSGPYVTSSGSVEWVGETLRDDIKTGGVVEVSP